MFTFNVSFSFGSVRCVCTKPNALLLCDRTILNIMKKSILEFQQMSSDLGEGIFICYVDVNKYSHE